MFLFAIGCQLWMLSVILALRAYGIYVTGSESRWPDSGVSIVFALLVVAAGSILIRASFLGD